MGRHNDSGIGIATEEPRRESNTAQLTLAMPGWHFDNQTLYVTTFD
jgi:hypothetical protein